MTANNGKLAAALVSLLATMATTLLVAPAALAQRTVPFNGNNPVAPQGISNRPLAAGPFDYATAEGQDIRVVVVAKGLSFPFGLAFLPDGTLLVTERTGGLRAIRNGKLDPNPVKGGPESVWAVASGEPGTIHGYMNIAVHPQFAQNKLHLPELHQAAAGRQEHAPRWRGPDGRERRSQT